MSLVITGTGSALPSHTVTNDDFAQIVDTSDEWISSRTGIRSRHICSEPSEGVRSLARTAAERALNSATCDPSEIGVCLVATFTSEYATPSIACLLQHDLGLPEDTLCFDLNAACAGFVYALTVADSLLARTTHRRALVVGVDVVSHVLDFSDRSTCVLFGDGAGAVIAEHTGVNPIPAVWGSRGNDEALVAPVARAYTPARGSVVSERGQVEGYLSMDGRAVFRFATEVLPKVTEEVLAEAQMSASDVDRFVFHQANKRIVDVAVRKLKLDPAKCAGNISHTGNTSAGSVPVLLDELVRENTLVAGNTVLMAGFGAGLTWAGCLVQLAGPLNIA